MNRLEQLIEEGENVRDSAKPDSYGIKMILTGEALETWSSKCIIFIDKECDNDFLSKKVMENSKDLTQNGYEKCLAILGVLKAIKESEIVFEI